MSGSEGFSILRVRVVPGAKVSAVAGVDADGVWKIRLAAKPVEGAANAELVRFLAEVLGLAKRDVVLESGLTGRHKRVRVGVGEEVLLARLGALLPL